MIRFRLFLLAVTSVLSIGWTEPSERGEPIPVPQGFDYTPPFAIYRGNGKPLGAVTSFDPQSRNNLRVETTYWVDRSRGDNSNDGLSPQRPFRSLWRALQGTQHRRVFIAAGRYDLDNGWRDARPRGDLTLIAPEGPAIITTHLPVAAVSLGGGRWRAEIPAQRDLAWGNVVDEAQPPAGRVLRKRDTQTLAPGEYFVDGTSLIFRLADDRAPDPRVLTLISHGNYHPRIEGNVFIQNVEFQGGRYGIEARIPPGCRGTFDRVTTRYSHGNASVGYLLGVGGELILNRCAGHNNYSDDFNWKSFPTADIAGHCVEIDCVSRYAGQNNDVRSTNASTTHGSIRLIRINGDYRLAQNRVVADIDNARTWNIACVAQGSRYNGPKRVWSQNWSFAGRVVAWVDQCQGSNVGDSSARGWSSEGAAQVYHRHSDVNQGDAHFTTPALPY